MSLITYHNVQLRGTSIYSVQFLGDMVGISLLCKSLWYIYENYSQPGIRTGVKYVSEILSYPPLELTNGTLLTLHIQRERERETGRQTYSKWRQPKAANVIRFCKMLCLGNPNGAGHS